MTLLVRDEADLTEQWLRYHFARGVDFVVATDHRSVDGTTDLLRAAEREGRLRLIRAEDEVLRQAEWVTAMARLAATEHGADWVVNSDADEFWWPRGGTLHELLGAVPARFGVVRGVWRQFVLRPDDERAFGERMTVRCRATTDLRSPVHAQVKVVHRGRPDVEVSTGNHDALAPGLHPIREWAPIEVLHFPLRSARQVEEKFLRRVTSPEGQHIVGAIDRIRSEGAAALVQSLLVDDAALDAGLADGSLILDTRLRDALRSLAAGAERLGTWTPSVADDADLAVDVDAALAHDARLRLDARAARVQRRLDGVERSIAVRLARRVA
jgi:hypothetical protein